MNERQLSQRIMRRVRRIYTLRKFINPLAVKLYGTILVFLSMSTVISVPDVARNAWQQLSDPNSFIVFMFSAVENTEVAVQIALGVATVLLLWITRDIISYERAHKRNAVTHTQLAAH